MLLQNFTNESSIYKEKNILLGSISDSPKWLAQQKLQKCREKPPKKAQSPREIYSPFRMRNGARTKGPGPGRAGPVLGKSPSAVQKWPNRNAGPEPAAEMPI